MEIKTNEDSIERIKRLGALEGFVTCTHPDHNATETCIDRAIGCDKGCKCCMEELAVPVPLIRTSDGRTLRRECPGHGDLRHSAYDCPGWLPVDEPTAVLVCLGWLNELPCKLDVWENLLVLRPVGKYVQVPILDHDVGGALLKAVEQMAGALNHAATH
jgi:hypothetical protein